MTMAEKILVDLSGQEKVRPEKFVEAKDRRGQTKTPLEVEPRKVMLYCQVQIFLDALSLD